MSALTVHINKCTEQTCPGRRVDSGAGQGQWLHVSQIDRMAQQGRTIVVNPQLCACAIHRPASHIPCG
jgi:hypothetical protein